MEERRTSPPHGDDDVFLRFIDTGTGERSDFVIEVKFSDAGLRGSKRPKRRWGQYAKGAASLLVFLPDSHRNARRDAASDWDMIGHDLSLVLNSVNTFWFSHRSSESDDQISDAEPAGVLSDAEAVGAFDEVSDEPGTFRFNRCVRCSYEPDLAERLEHSLGYYESIQPRES